MHIDKLPIKINKNKTFIYLYTYFIHILVSAKKNIKNKSLNESNGKGLYGTIYITVS